MGMVDATTKTTDKGRDITRLVYKQSTDPVNIGQFCS